MILALAFVGPFLGLVAALPLQVSATLLAFMLGTMIVTTARRLWPLGRPARIIAAAALVPRPRVGAVAETCCRPVCRARLGNPTPRPVVIGRPSSRRSLRGKIV